MTKRTRTVFGTHANLAHVWAQQTYGHGYSADRRMYFEGATIYSYGRHYPMARFTDTRTAEGKRVVLFKEDGYSVSTAKHRSHTRGALHGLNVKVWYVCDVNASASDNAAVMVRELASAIERLANPLAQKHVELASRLVELANRVQGVRDFMADMGATDTAALEAMASHGAAAITSALNAFNDPAKAEAREKARAKRWLAKATSIINASLQELEEGACLSFGGLDDAIEAWLGAGKALETVAPLIKALQERHAAHEVELTAKVLDPDASSVLWNRKYGASRQREVTPEQWQDGQGSGYCLPYNCATLVRRKGERLETSRGAEVPFRHAVLAYHKAAQCRREGATWHRNGEKVAVGVYQLDAIDEAGNIRAGCHTIAFEEMQRLAVREIPQQVRPSFPVPALIAS